VEIVHRGVNPLQLQQATRATPQDETSKYDAISSTEICDITSSMKERNDS